ncbi:hypothetical protein L207DRAFT_640588 [Hyaloscypha variabilis F]|uniref:Uncharacterized protein n=1 Tax=Hyaloscypha variabilis (strain UAMH 11265 / GT02V1 / F) TaxID=1149755 RepID=A0A2J6QZV8_HYAVF|nr:hypothetical protein L207DRAFT_640588 [Hyaloscypha variabilis F]
MMSKAELPPGSTHVSAEAKKRSQVKAGNLEEKVAGGRGAQTSVSVLEPVMWIERTKDNKYRIVATFKLQVKIDAFEKGYRKKFDKLFDYISVRYLYHEVEKHEIRPCEDNMVTFKATDDTTKTKSVDLSVEGNILTGAITPKVGVHVQRDNKITYERQSMSWRKGLSFESYFPRPNGESGWPGTAPIGDGSQYQHFEVRSSDHDKTCKCATSKSAHQRKHLPACRFVTSPEKEWEYDHCAHWFWQTEASAHLLGEAWNLVQHYLHFDFVVINRLRELGHGCGMRNPFSIHSSKPAEVRVKDDFGYPLRRDRVSFCFWSCPSNIHWPQHPTMNLQEWADQEVQRRGPIVWKVPDSEDFSKATKVKKAERKAREKKTETKAKEAGEKQDAATKRHAAGLPYRRNYSLEREMFSSSSEEEDAEYPGRRRRYPEPVGHRHRDEDSSDFDSDLPRGRSTTRQARHYHNWRYGEQHFHDRHQSISGSRPPPRSERHRRSSPSHNKHKHFNAGESSASPIPKSKEEDLEFQIHELKHEEYLRYLKKRRDELSSENVSSDLSDAEVTTVFRPVG